MDAKNLLDQAGKFESPVEKVNNKKHLSHAIEMEITDLQVALEKHSSGSTGKRDRRRFMRNEIRNRSYGKSLRHIDEISKLYQAYSPAAHHKKERFDKPFKSMMEDHLERGDWKRIPQSEIESSMEYSEVIEARFEIDFSEYRDWKMYRYGGARERSVAGRIIPECYRYILMEHIPASGDSTGLTRLNLYRDVPTSELEALFPKVNPIMKIKDLVKIYSSLVIGIILFIYNMKTNLEMSQALSTGDFTAISQSPVGIIAMIGALVYAFQVRNNFGNERAKYLEKITELRHDLMVASDDVALRLVAQMAWEQEAKEEMLTAEFLHHHEHKISIKKLDEEIEWFLEEIGEKIDFDVHDGIAKVVESGWGKLVGKDQVEPVARMVGLDMTAGDSPL